VVEISTTMDEEETTAHPQRRPREYDDIDLPIPKQPRNRKPGRDLILRVDELYGSYDWLQAHMGLMKHLFGIKVTSIEFVKYHVAKTALIEVEVGDETLLEFKWIRGEEDEAMLLWRKKEEEEWKTADVEQGAMKVIKML
jgi:hypothetical protein